MATIAVLAPYSLPLLRRRPEQPEEGEMSVTGLLDAAEALDALADGQQPDRTTVIVGALALSALRWSTLSDDIFAAAHGLAIIATGGTLDLDDVGRRRARHLARVVRATAGDRYREELPQASNASHYS
jgi:hypothetical protein